MKTNIERDRMGSVNNKGDEWLICAQCGNEFLFARAEQEKYQARGFDAPLRCPACRKHRSRLGRRESKDWNRDRRKKRDIKEYMD